MIPGGPLLHVAARVVIQFAVLGGGAQEAALASGAVPGAVAMIDNSRGDGLRIEWEVEKVRGGSCDQAKITIYNLARLNREAIAAAVTVPAPLEVALLIGWSGVPELVFTGEIWRCVASRRTGTDVLTVLEAGAGAAALKDTPPAGGAAVGIAMQLVVAEILKNAQLKPSPTAMATIAAYAAKVPVSQLMGYTADRGTTQLLDECLASIGLSWGIDRGLFVVYAGGLRNDLLPSVLTPATGLLSWEELGDGGVQFEGLAQARVTPGLQLQVLDLLGKMIGGGPLRVEKVTFTGSTEGESLMSGVARKVQVL